MDDPRFQSVYLEGLSRRDEFRAARQRIECACGEYTLGGDAGVGVQVGSGSSPLPGAVYWLRDGDVLYALNVGVNSVGRMPDNNVVLRDEHVSRRHCAVIVHQDGRCELHDVASKNGTILNGAKIHGPVALKPGDKIKLCNRTLTFVTGDSPAGVPSPSLSDAESAR